MNDIDIAEIVANLRSMGHEDCRYEVKECARKLSSDVWETVSAFANTEGGTILLGISEQNGFSSIPGFKANTVSDEFLTGMGDGGQTGRLTNPPSYSIQRKEFEGTIVLAITVDELNPPDKPCFITAKGVQGGSYKRVDDKDIRLSANEIYALQSATLVDTSDRQAVDRASVADLDKGILDLTFAQAHITAPRAMRNTETEEEQLQRLNFADKDGNVTKAGILAAGVYPQQFFPKLVVDVAVHPGTMKATGGSQRFKDRLICEGTIGEMIVDAVSAIAKNLRTESIIETIGRSDELEIPERALREAVTNALIHRSYNGRFDGESVAVDIFDDRVEITNPGGLWGKSKEDLNDGRSCCRNTTLIKLMSLVPLSKQAGSPAEGNGSGILLMINELVSRGKNPPEFRPSFDHFKVIFQRQPLTNSRRIHALKGKEAIEATLREGGTMSLREIAAQNGFTTNQARSRINALIQEGIVEPTAPSTSRNRKYRLAENQHCK